jgi:hypothetical protein
VMPAAIQVNTGMLTGSIEVHTPGLGATKASDYWSSDNNEDSFKLPNTIPISTTQLAEFQPYLDELRGLIASAKALPTQMWPGMVLTARLNSRSSRRCWMQALSRRRNSIARRGGFSVTQDAKRCRRHHDRVKAAATRAAGLSHRRRSYSEPRG